MSARRGGRMPQWARMSAMVIALVGTVLIGYLSFKLSFTSLTALVGEYSSAGSDAWMWAVGVDGLLVVAMVALFAQTGASVRERAWAIGLLMAGVLLSTAGNVIHAILAGYGPLGAVIGAVSPLLLAGVTHLSVQLLKYALIDEHDAVDVVEAEAVVSVDVGGERSDQGARTWGEVVPLEVLHGLDEQLSPSQARVSALAGERSALTVRVPGSGRKRQPEPQELAAWVMDYEREHGWAPTGDAVAKAFGRGASTGRRWLSVAKPYVDELVNLTANVEHAGAVAR